MYDTQNEHKEMSTDNRKPVSRLIDLDPTRFIGLCLTKKDTVCVFEDATGFIEGKIGADFRKVWISKRHTGNTNIAVFHSMSSAPPRLIQLSDYVVIFYTKDETYMVEKKFPSLLNDWLEVRSKAKTIPHFHKIIKL